MYKVFTPAGVIETDYKSALEYQRNYGYPIQRIPDEFDIEDVLGDETDTPETVYSDADFGF
jgi:hypothetical protein